MAGPGTEPPRPEDATSWPEFRARSAAVRANWGPGNSPTQARSQVALGLVSGVGAAVFLTGAILTSGLGRWTLAALTAVSAWMFVRYLPAGARRGAFGTRRYWTVVLLGGWWRARMAPRQARAAGKRVLAVSEQAREQARGATAQVRGNARPAHEQQQRPGRGQAAADVWDDR